MTIRVLAPLLLLVLAAAAQAAEGVTTLAQAEVTGAAAHPGDPALPGGRPVGSVFARSRADGGSQAIELKPATLAAGSRLIVLVHPGSRGRELRVVGIDGKGKRKELGKATLKPLVWQDCTVALADGLELDHLQLVSPGGESWWLSGAALHAGGEALLSDLAAVPDPLQPLGYDGSQGMTQVGRTLAAAPLAGDGVRVLLPGTGSADEKAIAERLLAACVAGWNTVPPPNPPNPDQTRIMKGIVGDPGPAIVAKPDSARYYANAAGFAEAADASLALLPQLLIIDLATARSPAVKPDAIAKLAARANRSGVIVVVVVEERPDDTRLLKEWKQWITVMHQAAPALGVIDLQEAHDWYDQPGATPEGANLLLGETIDRGATLRVAFTDLRARYQWVLYEARLEAAPSENTLRRRMRQR